MNKPTVWTLNDTNPRTDAPIRVFELTSDDGTEVSYRVERLSSGRLFVKVVFGDNRYPPAKFAYARAHAARLVAQIWDTIGDVLTTGDEPFEVDDPQHGRNHVEISGPAAVLVTAAYFGDAADALFNAYA